jgi:hypothetical protein
VLRYQLLPTHASTNTADASTTTNTTTVASTSHADASTTTNTTTVASTSHADAISAHASTAHS